MCYCVTLAFVHASAVKHARATAATLTQPRGETVLRVAAMPMFADPTEWLTVADTDGATYRYQIRLTNGAPPRESEVARFEKPQGAEVAQVARAEQDARAEVFLRFARFPVIRLEQDDTGDVLVQFADLRFTEPGNARSPGRGFSLEVRVPRATQ